MKISEFFDSDNIEEKMVKLSDGNLGGQRDILEDIKEVGEKVISENDHLKNMFDVFDLHRVSRNGRKKYREYHLDYGCFGLLFNFRDDKVTIHT